MELSLLVMAGALLIQMVHALVEGGIPSDVGVGGLLTTVVYFAVIVGVLASAVRIPFTGVKVQGEALTFSTLFTRRHLHRHQIADVELVPAFAPVTFFKLRFVLRDGSAVTG